MSSFADAAAAFRTRHPDLEAIEVFTTDLNGLSRGKLMPVEAMGKLGEGAAKLPVSALAMTIQGTDVEGVGIAIEVGDPDGVLIPDLATLSLMPWVERPTAQVIASLTDADEDGPAAFDPRGALVALTRKLHARGLRAAMAFEVEFYLIDPDRTPQGRPQPPLIPGTSERLSQVQIYELGVMRCFEPLLAEMREAARITGVPAETMIAEFGAGQFEMNLVHVSDPVTAADHAVLLKRAIRGVARRHGYEVTFMAKPYGEQAGSGTHVHLSLMDESGTNIFASGAPGDPNPALRHVTGGLLETMGDGMLIWAPHLNSYRRYVPSSYAPRSAAWGMDNRGVALRCPATSGKAARVEHRVAGADANPYLVAAMILGGALYGLDTASEPGAPHSAEPGPDDGLPLPLTWLAAIENWEQSERLSAIFPAHMQQVFARLKRQEYDAFLERVSVAEIETYLRRV
ncbi:MAG: glutamine synthetase family protein [Neomegalonema sp.]|nr:glutamine synthetase family protein [Neomegalonema sp.]